jgi:hypothetical protein
MQKHKIRSLLRQAIDAMLTEDAASSPAIPLLSTAERNLTARLREHLRRMLEAASLQVDHEYNRMGTGDSPKRSRILNRRIVPDIIYHERGVTADQNQSANKLAVEVKLIPEFDGALTSISKKKDRKELEKDLEKLQALSSREDDFRYQNTVSVVFAQNAVWMALDGCEFERLMKLRF